MTIADLVMMIAGFAIALRFALETGNVDRQQARQWQNPDPIGLLFIVLAAFVVSASLISLMRQVVYRRPALPAEWLVHVLSAALIRTSLPYWFSLDYLAGTALTGWGIELEPARRLVGGSAASLPAIAAGVLYLLRNRLPQVVTTLYVATLLVLWLMALPIIDDMLGLSSPLWSVGDTVASSRVFLWAPPLARNSLVSLPLFVPFGILAVATMRSFRATWRRWVWSEWFCFITAILTGLAIFGLFYSLLFQPIFGNVTEEDIVLRIVTPFWILGVAAASWGLIRIWGRLVKNPPNAKA
jgi:hypothetical protein